MDSIPPEKSSMMTTSQAKASATSGIKDIPIGQIQSFENREPQVTFTDMPTEMKNFAFEIGSEAFGKELAIAWFLNIFLRADQDIRQKVLFQGPCSVYQGKIR